MKFNVLTLTLNNFIAAFSAGYSRVSGAANSVLMTLVAIEVCLFGLWMALDGGQHLTMLFKKFLYIGVWIWLVRDFGTLSKAFVNSLVQAGLLAGGGGGGGISLLTDPSKIAGMGLDVTEPLYKKISDLGITDIGQLSILVPAYFLIIACFFIMAIHVFVAVIEYYLVMAVVGVLMPFGVLPATKFLAEKAIGAVVSCGIKLMVLALVISAVLPVMTNAKFSSAEITTNELFAMLLTSMACTWLSWHAPSFASGLMSGSPSLGAAEVKGGASAATGMGKAVGRMTPSGPIKGSASGKAASAYGGAKSYAGGVAPASSAALATASSGTASSLSPGGSASAASASLVKSVTRDPQSAQPGLSPAVS